MTDYVKQYATPEKKTHMISNLYESLDFAGSFLKKPQY